MNEKKMKAILIEIITDVMDNFAEKNEVYNMTAENARETLEDNKVMQNIIDEVVEITSIDYFPYSWAIDDLYYEVVNDYMNEVFAD